MDYFPVFVALRGRNAIVVGGGEPAARKVRLLVKAAAQVTVIAQAPNPELRARADKGEIAVMQRRFRERDVEGAAVVFGASGDGAIDDAVSRAARLAGVPVNVVDRPDLSTFIVPAIVDRSPIVVGISSGGAAPVLARRIRAEIEAMLPSGLGRLARFAGRFRAAVKANHPSFASRRRFWERFFDGPVAQAVLRGEQRPAWEGMLKLVNREETGTAGEGFVSIVGAGPGDPDLLTLSALRLLQTADVIVYDRLVGEAVLDYARRDAERIYVGKANGEGGRGQDEINALLVRLARDGKHVVRLKGGDPFVFGRGGEELDHLRSEGIQSKAVPGITAATACAAVAGLPLTHRGEASGITFLTGHTRDAEPDFDWAALAKSRQTLVIYMGLGTAGLVARRLIAHGMARSTPVAVIEKATLPDQRVVAGILAGLEPLIREHNVDAPALIVIGEVARRAAAMPECGRLAVAAG